MDPPPTFIDLAAAREVGNHTIVNIIGVVVDFQSVRVTKTGDYMLTFRLLDKPLSRALTGSEGLRLRFFSKPNEVDTLPKVRGIGDVVLMRNLKMTTAFGEKMGVANYMSWPEFLVFPSAAIPAPGFSIAFQDKQRIECLGIGHAVNRLKLDEQSYVIHVKHDMQSAVEATARKPFNQNMPTHHQAPETAQQPPAKRLKMSESLSTKFKHIKDLGDKMFSDLVVEVVKKSTEQYGCDLYVTDYTTNESVRYYAAPEEIADQEKDGDDFGYTAQPKKQFPGPYGNLVLKINLKHPHAGHANQYVNEGDIVLLRNVKSRFTSWTGMPYLEGDMWPDHISGQQINVRKTDLDLPERTLLLTRRELYWKTRNAKLSKTSDEQPQMTNKKRKKKERKEKRIAEAAQKEAAQENRNPHVRCGHEDVPLTGIREILDLDNSKHINTLPDGQCYTMPFMNAKYRTKVRVVDFEPKNLEDFAVQPEPGDGDGDSVDWMLTNYDGTPKFEWYFSLLVEDATTSASKTESDKDKMWVHLHHEQAQFLLGNEVGDPEDLKANAQLLGKLREKLFVLWGNLEEDGGKNLSNLPFECCVMEYGVELEQDDLGREGCALGWMRQYAMFGTTIQ